MMRILILIIMLLPCSLGMYASAIDSLLSVLDKTIVMRRQYEEEKERYISLIKDELKQGRLTDMERYLIQNRLFAEYNSYISDSALHYINENIRCNSISPARVHTPFVDGFINKTYPGQEKEMFEKLSKTQPIGRMAEPEEIAFARSAIFGF